MSFASKLGRRGRLTRRIAASVTILAVTGVLCAGWASGSPPTAFRGHQHHAQPGFSMTQRFARRVTRPGDVDSSPRHIHHVRELQHRLRWAGDYHGRLNGRYDPAVQHAVARFQRRAHLKVTGVANYTTWARLIRHTVRGRSALRAHCGRAPGWRVCYDRWRHQLTLWRGATLWNAWLVRGGTAQHVTRVGTFSVYWRDRHHVSSIYGTPMPFAQFFSGGEAIHGSVVMTNPFRGHSHGCINMYLSDAAQLWRLTSRHALVVRVYGAWS